MTLMMVHLQVSIPFKRESVSKGLISIALVALLGMMFQFPSNGKAYPKLLIKGSSNSFRQLTFQFPSNGKAYPKCFNQEVGQAQAKFQFPSNGKAYPKNLLILRLMLSVKSFNSLQTGKRIQRDPILHPVGPWLQNPKTLRELRGAFFVSKFTPKIP